MKDLSLNKTSQLNKLNSLQISKIVDSMLDKSLYSHMLDIIDETENFNHFNDLEMIYLFVHEEKDQDERKNRTVDTKREYFRELLWIYHLFIHQGKEIGYEPRSLDIYTVFKQLQRQHIRKFQDWLKSVPLGKGGKTYSVATISRKTVIFKAFLKFLYDRDYIRDPLHQTFKSAQVHMRDRPNRDLYTDEAIQLLSYYESHPIIYGFLAVLLTTGARIREIAQARMCDLTYESEGYWLEVIGKGKERRELFIFPNVFTAIKRFRRRRGLDTVVDKNDRSPIFVTARHNAYSYKYLSKYLSNALQNADLPFIQDEKRSITPHSLRHGFAIISADQGADIYRIMQALGHKKIDTTMIYLEKYQQRKNHVAHTWKQSSVIKNI